MLDKISSFQIQMQQKCLILILQREIKINLARKKKKDKSYLDFVFIRQSIVKYFNFLPCISFTGNASAYKNKIKIILQQFVDIENSNKYGTKQVRKNEE